MLIAECLKRLKEADAEGTDMPQADREEAVMMDDSKPEVKTQIHEKDAVMIGDRMFDIDGGHACGIDTVGVLYGYGNREEFEKAGAEYIISRPEELLTLEGRSDRGPFDIIRRLLMGIHKDIKGI